MFLLTEIYSCFVW